MENYQKMQWIPKSIGIIHSTFLFYEHWEEEGLVYLKKIRHVENKNLEVENQPDE